MKTTSLPIAASPRDSDRDGIIYGDEDIAFLEQRGFLPTSNVHSVAELHRAREAYLRAQDPERVERQREARLDLFARNVGDLAGPVLGTAAVGSGVGAIAAAALGASLAAGALVGAVTLPVGAVVGLLVLMKKLE